MEVPFSCPKGGLTYETYNQGSYSAPPSAKATTVSENWDYILHQSVPSFYQKKDSLILALSKGYTSFSEALEKHFWNTAGIGFLITASMKPAGIRTLPGGIALLTGSLSRVIRF